MHLVRETWEWRVVKKTFMILILCSKTTSKTAGQKMLIISPEWNKESYYTQAMNTITTSLFPRESDEISLCKRNLKNIGIISWRLENIKESQSQKPSEWVWRRCVKENETIRENQVRFQLAMNGLKLLGKVIPQQEINMNILSDAHEISSLKWRHWNPFLLWLNLKLYTYFSFICGAELIWIKDIC